MFTRLQLRFALLVLLSQALNGCDLLFIPQIFPPEMNLVQPLDTVRLRSGLDSLRLEFRIRDEDGDLGRDSGDQTRDLWLLEVRYGFPPFDSTYREFSVPNLTPRGANKVVDAQLELLLDPFETRADLDVDSLQLYAVLRDRSGNFSPVLTLPTVYLWKATN
jgi:hypothetical protein